MIHNTDYFSENHNSKGFTLIEMLVVVAIIATLAAMIVPNLMQGSVDAQLAANKANIQNLKGTLQRYKLDNFTYPSSQQGLEALVDKPSGSPEPKNWKGYLDSLPKDPWGNPYYYKFPGEHGTFDIYSLGADGLPGGEEENADIGNWNMNE